MNFDDVAIVAVRRNNYWIHFLDMTNSEAVNRMKNDNLSENSIQLQL